MACCWCETLASSSSGRVTEITQQEIFLLPISSKQFFILQQPDCFFDFFSGLLYGPTSFAFSWPSIRVFPFALGSFFDRVFVHQVSLSSPSQVVNGRYYYLYPVSF
ncbi:unnamed protein product [Amoebophrya sp. A120]|nr:unnamed protein product [Amoebophrya sp. A120]|eukprot:GSA120T00007071001.1